MASRMEPEIILYDLACTKAVCFSPVVWRIRLMLNYKGIPYRTIFLEFPDIEPTLKELGIVPDEKAAGKYTVPAIHHIPSKTYMMDSAPIAQFLETTYPDSPVPLTSELGRDIEVKARGAVGPPLRFSIMPRETRILSPPAQEYFRRTREPSLGHPLEDMLDAEKEDQMWKQASGGLTEVSEMLRTNKAEGPFILGATPSYTDFFIAGTLQCARVIDEGIFQRPIAYSGFKEVYEACLPYMEKRD